MRQSGIYRIRNIVNGKIYIGSSKQLNTRWPDHIQRLKRNQHHSILLQRAWNKYGQDKFIFEIIEPIDEFSTQKYLRDREQYWLDFYDAANKQKGYNISKNTQIIDIPPYKRTEEHKKEMSEKLTGRILSKKWKEKISRTRKERHIPNPNKGKKFGIKSSTIERKKNIKEFCFKNGYRPTAESVDLTEQILGRALLHCTDTKRPEYDSQIESFVSVFPTRKQFYQTLKREEH